MEQQTNEMLKEFGERIISLMDATTVFAQEQIPEVINEVLWWYGIHSFIFFVFGILGVILVVFSVKKYREYLGNHPRAGSGYNRVDKDGPEFFVPTVMFGGPVILAFSGMISHNLDWLQILVAPRLFLIQYAAELVK